MQNLLFITPHLSTGGLPQFLLDKISILSEKYNIYLIEWQDITGGKFIVQRDQLISLLNSNFYTLNDNKQHVFEILNQIQPHIIHFEEIAETFIPDNILAEIYRNDSYVITESTHGISFNMNFKKFQPDKFLAVSPLNYEQTVSRFNTELIKYPIRYKNRLTALTELGLNPTYKHILNVGLFTPGKNQGEIIEYARKMKDEKIKFHFIGNQADNFSDYWKPLMENLPDNCVIWGEQANTAKFYHAMDLFLFTSKFENRPLSVLEAVSHNMNILMYNLDSYGDEYSKYNQIQFLTSDLEYNTTLIKRSLEIPVHKKMTISIQSVQNQIQKTKTELNSKISAYHILTDISTQREIDSQLNLIKLEETGINYSQIISLRYTDDLPVTTAKHPDQIQSGKLRKEHYGCYLGHKTAFLKGISNHDDWILIFECDCLLDVTIPEFKTQLNRAMELVNKHDLLMFSFGSHNDIISKTYDDFIITNQIYGAHAYLIPKKSFHIFEDLYENKKWNVTDLLFTEEFKDYKIGMFHNPITKQAAGQSIIDNVYHEERY